MIASIRDPRISFWTFHRYTVRTSWCIRGTQWHCCNRQGQRVVFEDRRRWNSYLDARGKWIPSRNTCRARQSLPKLSWKQSSTAENERARHQGIPSIIGSSHKWQHCCRGREIRSWRGRGRRRRRRSPITTPECLVPDSATDRTGPSKRPAGSDEESRQFPCWRRRHRCWSLQLPIPCAPNGWFWIPGNSPRPETLRMDHCRYWF
mmetsp:Transcript_18481/g.51575  ORF Transcript_18481/g.51575 Transcript_18481/m.51575 type:complete len:205 (+) Transcript_18481:3123-3737(+)